MNGREIRMGIPCFLHGEYFKVYCFLLHFVLAFHDSCAYIHRLITN